MRELCTRYYEKNGYRNFGCVSCWMHRATHFKKRTAKHINGRYMGTKGGFHHFTVQEPMTVFYRHVKISVDEYGLDSIMPYTTDENKWKAVAFPIELNIDPSSAYQNPDGSWTIKCVHNQEAQ